MYGHSMWSNSWRPNRLYTKCTNSIFCLCSFWLLILSFSWETRSWPWVQRNTFLLHLTSTLTSSTFSSTSWQSWDAPASEAAPRGEQLGDGERLPLFWNVAKMPLLVDFITLFDPLLFPLPSHRVLFLRGSRCWGDGAAGLDSQLRGALFI